MNGGRMRSLVAGGLAVAVAGLFIGHVLAYRIAAPDPLQRAVVLNGTGHSYLPLALVLGAFLAVLAGGGAFVLGFRRATGLGGGRSPMGLAAALAIPAIAQALAFVALETLEHALAGAPMGSLLGPLLPIGVVLQLLVGAAGGLVLAGLARAGELTGRVLVARRPPARSARQVHAGLRAAPKPKPAPAGSGIIRGPPLPA